MRGRPWRKWSIALKKHSRCGSVRPFPRSGQSSLSIWIMPRAQRMRCPMCAASVSVERPEATGLEMKALFQPRRLSLRDVWASSVTVSTAMPPTSLRAERRITALEPQNIVAFQVSLPRWMKS